MTECEVFNYVKYQVEKILKKKGGNNSETNYEFNTVIYSGENEE